MFSPDRYEKMTYNRCGRSGLMLPAVSLGCWHNWGHNDDLEEARRMMRRAFDLGINLFDFANNYGPPPGAAEINAGRILREDFASHRDELTITSKAGFRMWPGPMGEWGSRKYLITSCDASLKRMGLDHFDVFYSHRFDPETPLEETMGALDFIVRSGRAIYAGISNHGPDETRRAVAIAKELGTPIVINQVPYSMLNRTIETSGLLATAAELGIGVTVFCPLAQGLLTDKYIDGIPEGSRASKAGTFLPKERVTPEVRQKLKALQGIARRRGQSIARLALDWILRDRRVTSILVGASKVAQIEDSTAILKDAPLTAEELAEIDTVLA